jgi:hypothetical protein
MKFGLGPIYMKLSRKQEFHEIRPRTYLYEVVEKAGVS